MSKFDSLWKWIEDNGSDKFELSFDDIKRIVGVPIDHSFLTYKKELNEYGYEVAKISMKENKVLFRKR